MITIIMMKICLICRKRFIEIDKHHVSYEFNNAIEVCKKCHRKIHQTKQYPHLKPMDKPSDTPVRSASMNGKAGLKTLNAVPNVNDTYRLSIRKSRIFATAELKSLNSRLKGTGDKADATGIFAGRVKPKILEMLEWFGRKKELEKVIKVKKK